MKHIILIAFYFLSLCSFAQSYESQMFEDGKYWICGSSYGDRLTKVSVVGDTIIGGVTARKLQSEILATGEKSKDYRIGYEKDNKVYIWLNNEFRLFFNFSSQETEIPVCDYNGRLVEGFRISISTPTIMGVEGVNRRFFSVSAIEFGEYCLCAYDWYEGIGTECTSIVLSRHINSEGEELDSHYDPFWSMWNLVECYKDEKCIFKSSNVYDYYNTEPYPDLSSITETSHDSYTDEPLYDLMGRRIERPQPGRIYVTPSGKRIFKD